MKMSKACLAVLLSVAAVAPAVSKTKPSDVHLVASTGHPVNPFMWLFRHRINHAPKGKR